MTDQTNRISFTQSSILTILKSIAPPENEEAQFYAERELKQKLESKFNLGEFADAELYADLARAFVRCRTRYDSIPTNKKMLDKKGGVHSQIMRESATASGEDDDSDSDLSLGDNYESPDLVPTKSGSEKVSTGMSPTLDSDESDHDSEAEEMEIQREQEIIEEINDMHIDQNNRMNGKNNTNHRNESDTSGDFVSNNLMKEFELMGRNTEKENAVPSSATSPSYTSTVDGMFGKMKSFSSFFRSKDDQADTNQAQPTSENNDEAVFSKDSKNDSSGNGSAHDNDFKGLNKDEVPSSPSYTENENAQMSGLPEDNNEYEDAHSSFQFDPLPNEDEVDDSDLFTPYHTKSSKKLPDNNSSMKHRIDSANSVPGVAVPKMPESPSINILSSSLPRFDIGVGSSVKSPNKKNKTRSDISSKYNNSSTFQSPLHISTAQVSENPEFNFATGVDKMDLPPPPTSAPKGVSSENIFEMDNENKPTSTFDSPIAPTNSSVPEFQFRVDLKSDKLSNKRASPRLKKSFRSSTKGSKKKLYNSLPNNFDTQSNMNGSSTSQAINLTAVKTPQMIDSASTGTPKSEMDIDTPTSKQMEFEDSSPVGNTSPSKLMNINGFSIGTGTPSRKASFRKARSNIKAKSNSKIWSTQTSSTPEKTNKTQPPSVTAPIFKSPELIKRLALDKARLEQVAQLREEAKVLYTRKDYKQSILTYTAAMSVLTAKFTSIPKPLKKTEESEILASLCSNRAAGLMMVGAFAAAASDCRKALEHLKDYNPLSMNLDNEAELMSYLRADGGITLMSKISARLGRAFMKLGNIEDARKAVEQTMRILNSASVCHQKIQAHAAQNGMSIPRDMQGLSEKVLLQCKTDAVLNMADLKKITEDLNGIERMGGVVKDIDSTVASNINRQIYPKINAILQIAPGNVEMQESKVLCLASLKRWSELSSYCEGLACANILSEGVFTEDLKELNSYPKSSPATYLQSAISTDDELLNARQVAEAVQWIPRRIVKLYMRSLRLEERYIEASHACVAMASLLESECNEPIWSPNQRRQKAWLNWIEKEKDKIRNTMKWKDEGDSCYRQGEYTLAAKKYAEVLLIDSDKIGFYSSSPWECETAGGRLHAVLHCNRAACLMALRLFDEAAKECTAALRLQTNYMKALLRRARCYARLERFDESISEYNHWSGLVQEAKANPYARNENDCSFDRGTDVSDRDYQKTMAELAEVIKLKKNQEQKLREAAENAKRRASSAFNRRQQWYDQQEGTSGPRRWDSFNGSSPKREPNRRSYSTSRRNASSFRSSTRHNSTNDSDNSSSRRKKSQQSKANKPSPQRKVKASPTSSSVTCHYAVLQVLKTVSQSDIKKAYHKLALKYHPDKNSSDSAADVFRKIKLAYETLSNEKSRRLYDMERSQPRF